MKKTTIIFLGILLTWFTLDITGFAINKFILVTSAFKDEPIDILFWFIFLIGFTLFIWKDKIGKYFMAAFLLLWGLFQYQMYFLKSRHGIESYNNFFKDTNHIIPASNTILIKDTYHMFLDIFILLSFVCIIVFILNCIINSKKAFLHNRINYE